jgi:hypothetical protein
MKTREAEKKSTSLEGNTEGRIGHIDAESEMNRSASFDRRALMLRVGGAAAATAAGMLPAALAADESPSSPSKQRAPAPTEAFIDAALAVSPAELSPEQRLDVRNGARELHKALADARKVDLAYGVEPAFVFLPEGRR